MKPLTSSTPTPIDRALHPSGARTDVGSVSSSTTTVPDAPRKATIPRAMRAPTPPHQGHVIVPIDAIRSTGRSAFPSSPIRTRTVPSPTSA